MNWENISCADYILIEVNWKDRITCTWCLVKKNGIGLDIFYLWQKSLFHQNGNCEPGFFFGGLLRALT